MLMRKMVVMRMMVLAMIMSNSKNNQPPLGPPAPLGRAMSTFKKISFEMPLSHPDDHQDHQDLHLNLLAADSGPVHHLLRLVGLLLRAEGDEGIPDQDKLVKKLSLLLYIFNLL